jgi:hypothetical protein
MHAMALSAILLTIAAAVFSIGAFADPDVVRHRGVWRALAAGSLIVGISMWLMVSYAQRPTCVALGGRWIDESEACRNEWGGNGDNDPSNPTFVIVAEVEWWAPGDLNPEPAD